MKIKDEEYQLLSNKYISLIYEKEIFPKEKDERLVDSILDTMEIKDDKFTNEDALDEAVNYYCIPQFNYISSDIKIIESEFMKYDQDFYLLTWDIPMKPSKYIALDQHKFPSISQEMIYYPQIENFILNSGDYYLICEKKEQLQICVKYLNGVFPYINNMIKAWYRLNPDEDDFNAKVEKLGLVLTYNLKKEEKNFDIDCSFMIPTIEDLVINAADNISTARHMPYQYEKDTY